MIKIKLILSILLFLFIFLSKISLAETEMQIKTVFNGYHKRGHWLPLRITVDNQGKSLIGNLSVESHKKEQTYITPISIIGELIWERSIYIYPGDGEQNVKIKLIDDNNKLILEKEARFNFISEDNRFVAVIDQDGDIIKTDQSQKIYVVNAKIDELPDSWIGYDPIDAIILGSFSPNSMSENQKQALIDWLYDGGILIMSGGTDSQNLMGSFIERFLPVKIKGTKIVRSIPSIEKRFSYGLPNIPVVVALSEPVIDGRIIIAEDDGLPIVSERNIGNGKIVFLAYDFADPIFNLWEGNNELWSLIISLKNKLAKPKYESISRFISENSKVAQPSYEILGLFLISYLLCISVVLHIFLKRNSGKILLFISLTVIIFSVFAYGFNHIVIGRSLTLIDYSVVSIYKDIGRARIISFFSLFSPNMAEFKLNFNNANTVFIESPVLKGEDLITGLVFLQDDISQMAVKDLKVFRNRLFYARSYIDLKDNILIKELNDNKVEVINNMSFDILDCCLFLGKRYVKIGAVSPDSHNIFSVDQNFFGNVFDNYSVDDEKRSKFISLVRSSLLPDNSDKVFIGWIDGSALQKFAKMDIDKGYKPYGNCLIIEVL